MAPADAPSAHADSGSPVLHIDYTGWLFTRFVTDRNEEVKAYHAQLLRNALDI